MNSRRTGDIEEIKNILNLSYCKAEDTCSQDDVATWENNYNVLQRLVARRSSSK